MNTEHTHLMSVDCPGCHERIQVEILLKIAHFSGGGWPSMVTTVSASGPVKGSKLGALHVCAPSTIGVEYGDA